MTAASTNKKGIMLAKVKPVDYFYLPDHHQAVDARLQEWARWVRVRSFNWQTHPMWRNTTSNWRQWHQPEISDPVNTLAAMEVEKAVSKLPSKHRDALRWAYVFKGNPVAMARNLAVSKDGLMDLINNGRTMLKNSLA